MNIENRNVEVIAASVDHVRSANLTLLLGALGATIGALLIGPAGERFIALVAVSVALWAGLIWWLAFAQRPRLELDTEGTTIFPGQRRLRWSDVRLFAVRDQKAVYILHRPHCWARRVLVAKSAHYDGEVRLPGVDAAHLVERLEARRRAAMDGGLNGGG